MTFMNPMHRTPLGAVTLYRIASTVGAAFDAAAKLSGKKTHLKTAESLTPDQLEDIGLTRADVETNEIGPIAALLTSMVASYDAWVERRRTADMLRGLSQRQLDDVGIMAGDIERFERSGTLR